MFLTAYVTWIHTHWAFGSRGEGTIRLPSTLQKCCRLTTALFKSAGAHSMMWSMSAATKAKGLLIIQGAGLGNCIINPKTMKIAVQWESAIVVWLGALHQVNGLHLYSSILVLPTTQSTLQHNIHTLAAVLIIRSNNHSYPDSHTNEKAIRSNLELSILPRNTLPCKMGIKPPTY